MPNAVVVQSLGSLSQWTPDWAPRAGSGSGSLRLYDGFTHDYAAIYRTQPNVRTVVEFLARNIAQLGLHTYRRVSDTDRQRLTDHPLAQRIKRPNPWTTRYRLIEALISDLAIYNRAYWLKANVPEQPFALLRVPPALVRDRGNFLVPKSYRVDLGEGKTLELDPSQLVHFRGYHPENNVTAISPLETLRRILAEEAAAGSYRERFWRNAARMGGMIQRPAEAPEWSDVARSRFLQEFEAMYSGEANSGKTAVLEDGMTWHAGTFSADQSQYIEGRKLTREEVARAYHIPLPMVGILDHATFSNVEEQHKNLYQDTLGPWLRMGEEEIELQLLPEFDDRAGVYVEFNIQEKLAGSFEDQAKTLQAAVGRPWMTAAEARARTNLPDLGGDSHELVTPLNVLVGGQASPQDSAPPAEGAPKLWLPGVDQKAKAAVFDPTNQPLRARHREKWAQVLVAFFGRQSRAVESAMGGKRLKAAVDDIFKPGRWNGELKADLFKLSRATAVVWARSTSEALGGDLDEDRMDEYLAENARIGAERVNQTTRDELAMALGDDDPLASVRRVFEIAMGSRAAQIAFTKVTNAANFGTHEGAKQSGVAKKTWQVNSGNPRSSHAALNGETADMGKPFSNGMRWPADGTAGLGPEEIARCLPATALVDAPLLEGAYRRWYDGELVRIRTAGGHELSVTPNHPILTDRGWVAAGALHEGDCIIRGALAEEVAGRYPDIQHGPSLIGQVFDALARLGATERIGGRRVDFHGDGQGGEVQVVRANGLLRDGRQSALRQPLGKQGFPAADISLTALFPQRPLDERFGGWGLASLGGVGGGRNSLAFLAGHLSHPERVGFRLAAEGNALFAENAVHGWPPNPEGSRKRLFGLASLVASRGLRTPAGRDVDSALSASRTARSNSGAALMQDPVDRADVSSGVLGQSLHRFASFIAADHIVGVERHPFSGHVYNLQTGTGWYIANGVIVHNCECSVVFDRSR